MPAARPRDESTVCRSGSGVRTRSAASGTRSILAEGSEAGPSRVPLPDVAWQQRFDARLDALLTELRTRTDALANAQSEMKLVFSALSASMLRMEQRLDEALTSEADEDDEEDGEEEELIPVVGKGKGRATK